MNDLKELVTSKLNIPITSDEQLRSTEITNELIKLAKQGDKDAQLYLYVIHKGLIKKVAFKFKNIVGIDNEDLLLEGYFGFIKAVEKFDASKGCEFSTHAFKWIMAYMTRAIANQSRNIRLPEETLNQIRKIKKAKEELPDDHTTEDLAKHSGVSQKRIEELQIVPTLTDSLDELIFDETDKKSRYDFLSGNDQDVVFDAVWSAEKSSQVRKMFREIQSASKKKILERDLEIYELRCEQGMPFKEIAKQLNVTIQTVSNRYYRFLHAILRTNGKELAALCDDEDWARELLKASVGSGGIKKYRALIKSRKNNQTSKTGSDFSEYKRIYPTSGQESPYTGRSFVIK